MPECLHFGTQKWPPHTQNSYYQNSMTVHWAYHIANSFYFSCNEQVSEILNLYHPVKESFRNPQLVTPCRRKAVPFQILDNVITHTCFPSIVWWALLRLIRINFLSCSLWIHPWFAPVFHQSRETLWHCFFVQPSAFPLSLGEEFLQCELKKEFVTFEFYQIRFG